MSYRDLTTRVFSEGGSMPAPEEAQKNQELLNWAVSRWNDEVKHRPRCNIYRPILDSTWRQVITFAGGDPIEVLGCERQVHVETQE